MTLITIISIQQKKKLDSVINYYNSQAALVNSDPDLKNKMSGDILLIRTIKELIEQQKVSSSNNAEMTKTFTQMKKISDYSKQGEQYFRSNKMKESEEAFNSAISQVKDVENAFDRLKNIEKYNADVKALPLYNSAMKNLRNNKADAAFTEFSQVIRDYPTSSYSFQSLDQINKIVELKSKEETKPIDETKPKAIFSEANTLYNNKKYQESINKYYELIINYPTSTYIKDSTTNIQKINNIIVSEQKIDNMDEVTKEKFKSEYSKFLTAINRNELKDARDYYFNALNLIINPYTNETIPKFYEAEERYIASLLEGKVDKSSVSTKELEDKYRAEIDNLRKKYEDDIAKLSNTNTKDLENRHKLEIDALKKKYEDDIAKLASSNNTKALEDRHKTEIDALKKKYDDDIAKLASSNNTKDLEDKYKAEMDSLRKKYEADIARLTSSSTKELEEKHRLEIDALRKKYEAELDRSLRERMALDTRDIEEKLENKYKKELEFEKTKIIDDYKYQMEALRKEQDVNKVLTPTELISGKGSLYVGRVIERIDKSITFQLLSKDFVNYIGNGDRLTVIRRDKDNIERFVGYVDVLFITDSSLFARGIVTNETKLEIAPNDILIYTKKENK